MLCSKTTEHSLFDWGASLFVGSPGKVQAFVAIKKSAGGHLFEGPDPDEAHITALAFRDPIVMVELLSEAKSALRQRGIYRLVFGADHDHILPGVPDESPAIENFLSIEGFEISDTLQYDVERDLSSYEVPDWIKPAMEGVEIRISTAEDKRGLEQFLTNAFPGRWRHDAIRAFSAGHFERIAVLVVDGAIHGFAYLQDSSCTLPIAGGVWHLSLGDKWGSLGPIGISQEVRGRKLGHAMLAGGLEILRDRGVRNCIIDWTTLLDFYGAHGFEISRRYRRAYLDLRAPN